MEEPNQMEFSVGGVVNPMMSEDILERFFNVVPFLLSDFKSFNLVCKLWSDLAFVRWRQEAWLVVRDGPKRGSECFSGFHFSSTPALELLDLPDDPFELFGKHPFRKYALRQVWDVGFCHKDRREFWERVGPLMSHLEISSSRVWKREDLRRILLELTPNLETLVIKGNMYLFGQPQWRGEGRVGGGRTLIPVWKESCQPARDKTVVKMRELEINLGLSREFPLQWMQFLAHYPNLKILKLSEFPEPLQEQEYEDNQLVLFFKSLEVVRQNCGGDYFSELQELELINASRYTATLFPTTILSSLQRLSFPLTSLSIDIGYKQNVNGFQRILELYSDTLEKLVVYRGPYHEARRFTETFPCGVNLSHLRDLRLIGPIWQNLQFLTSTPKLKILVILDGRNEVEPVLLHSYLDSFSLPSLECKIPPNQKKWKYSYDFPVIACTDFLSDGLKSLVLPQMEQFILGDEVCSEAQVTELVRLMPNLRKLRLGLDTHAFKMACQTWKYLKHLDVEPMQVNEAEILPNLVHLQYLDYFRLGRNPQNFLLHDATVQEIRAEEKLKHVTVAVSNRMNIVNSSCLRDVVDSRSTELSELQYSTAT